jgi:outer membrane protein OmpA-like peptidoglycan-associated protein
MRRPVGADNTAYPLTDLMTSLMVIFVLLLLVFLNNQASTANTSLAPTLQNDLKISLDLPAKSVELVHDSGDSYTVVIATNVTFEPGKHDLNGVDSDFLRAKFSQIAKLVCDDRYRDQVQELAVEGHADGTGYRGSTREASLGLNLKLSQERSMTVVREAILPLIGEAAFRRCLEEKISANGRGEPELESDSESAVNRRVFFKIRMRTAPPAGELQNATGNKPETAPAVLRPEVLKMLELFRALRSVPQEPVSFHLTEDEINAYLEYALSSTPRPGIESIKIKIFKNNYISTLVQMDLDALAKSKGGTMLAPFHPFMNGQKELWLDFRFAVADAKVTFTIEKAYYQKTAVPLALVKEIIRLAAILQPEHYQTNSPIPLPFQLRQIRTEDRILTGEN